MTDDPKILIVATSYLGDTAQKYGPRLVTLWARLIDWLNPDCDVVIVDSASPEDPGEFLRPLGYTTVPVKSWTETMFVPRHRTVLRLPDNIGHLNVTGVDGWGRALSCGLRQAIEHRYDYVAYMDVDVLFARPVRQIVDKMHRFGVLAACPMDMRYNFLENGLMFLSVAYLKESDFVGRYDWESRSGQALTPMTIPERAFETLLEDVIFTLPLRGMRNDQDLLTVNNIAFSFPYGGPDYLTHCKDFGLYERFLELNGIAL